MFTEASEHEVLVALGEHLGRLANRDLAARCALGAGSKHLGRAERKRALTPQSRGGRVRSRAARRRGERQILNYRDELADKQAAVAAIVERLAKPVGEPGGYATKQERFAKQKRLQSLRRRVGWLEGRVEAGHVSVVRGGKRLLSLRNNLKASDMT